MRQIIDEIDAMQQKLNERTDKLNAMKNRHNELTRTLDETETHLKQASKQKKDNGMNVPARISHLECFFDYVVSSKRSELIN